MKKCIEEVGARAVRDLKTDGTKAISRVGCSYRGLTPGGAVGQTDMTDAARIHVHPWAPPST